MNISNKNKKIKSSKKFIGDQKRLNYSLHQDHYINYSFQYEKQEQFWADLDKNGLCFNSNWNLDAFCIKFGQYFYGDYVN